MTRSAPLIRQREYPENPALTELGPLLSRIYSARGVRSVDELELSLRDLEPYHRLKGIESAVAALLPVVLEQKKLLVVGDFDADGATSTALVLRAMRMLGAQNLDYLVPDRFGLGYGLSPGLVDVAKERLPDLIMTVDNGIASVSGVQAAADAGIPVLVTDHHLPGDQLPDALAMVNPNQPGCEFPSKSACGCTVAFYLMLALRAELVRQGVFDKSNAPNLTSLVDLVALATVADVVPLDRNNRILVEQGLRRIRSGVAQPGVLALLQVAGKDYRRITSMDFGFAIGPRINAAGRLTDMSLGIECLLTDDPAQALEMAAELDSLNRERRQIEQSMQADALTLLDRIGDDQTRQTGVCLFHPEWHQGVIGILASRIKERLYRPVIAFAPGDDGTLKGSARSIPGLHMRDALDLTDKRHPGLISKFGGHAMAAGLTLNADGFSAFSQAFDSVCAELMNESDLHHRLDTDGELTAADFSLELAETLRVSGPWGQGFPEPLFEGEFRLLQQRLVGGNHLKLMLQTTHSDAPLDAICFNIDTEVWPDYQREKVRCVYQLDVNEYRGQRSLQLLIRHIE